MRILFASPFLLNDTTNGCAVTMRTLLGRLAAMGHNCEALTGAHSPESGVAGEAPWEPVNPGRERMLGFPVFRVEDGGLRHTCLDIPASRRSDLGVQEAALSLLLSATVEDFRPDLLLLTGRPTTLAILPAQLQRSLPTVAYVSTALPVSNPDLLNRFDTVLVPSRFLARYYEDQGVRCEVAYPLVDGSRICRSRRGARYATLITPAPEKGVRLLFRIAREARRGLPKLRFLLVEGRWTRSRLRDEGLLPADLHNLRFLPNQSDVREVYRRTRFLLFPSLWDEAFGRSLIEAQANGIPVIAHRVGGIPEALNGAGLLIDPPSRLRRNYLAEPASSAVTPWLDGLKQLSEDSRMRASAARRARRAAQPFVAGTHTIEPLLERFRSLIARGAGQ